LRPHDGGGNQKPGGNRRAPGDVPHAARSNRESNIKEFHARSSACSAGQPSVWHGCAPPEIGFGAIFWPLEDAEGDTSNLQPPGGK
jgi:hypothetical protein